MESTSCGCFKLRRTEGKHTRTHTERCVCFQVCVLIVSKSKTSLHASLIQTHIRLAGCHLSQVAQAHARSGRFTPRTNPQRPRGNQGQTEGGGGGGGGSTKREEDAPVISFSPDGSDGSQDGRIEGGTARRQKEILGEEERTCQA